MCAKVVILPDSANSFPFFLGRYVSSVYWQDFFSTKTGVQNAVVRIARVYAYGKAHRRAAVLAYSHSNQKLLPEPRSIERHSSLNQVPAAADKEEVWQ